MFFALINCCPGNYSFEKDHLKLGESLGNHFKLVFREVRPVTSSNACSGGDGDETLGTTIRESFENVKNNGFINYFGTQRFGSGSNTHKIGARLLKKQFEKAVELILVPKKRDIVVAPKECPLPDNFQPKPCDAPKASSQEPSESPELAPQKPEKRTRVVTVPSYNECMKEWQESKDSDSVYKQFHWKKSNEGLILKQLMQTRNNYQSSFLSLPRNARSMYLHAYQSSLWNRIVSERIKKYGLKVLLGDLVLIDNGDLDGDNACGDQVAGGNVSKGKKGRKKDRRRNRGEEEKPVAADSDEDEDFIPAKMNAVIVDEQLINRVTIFDVVFPMVGRKIKLPENEFKER